MTRDRSGSERDERAPTGDDDRATRPSTDRTPGRVADLHRAMGNQAVQALHERGDLLANSGAGGSTGDSAEREAERAAAAVASGRDPPPVRDRSRELRRSPSGDGERDPRGDRPVESFDGGGQSLPGETRSFFEERFGRDFGDVSVHTGSRADRAARSIDARAFTVGSDVAFRKGEYAPDTDDGKRLLAHELTHVAQQDGGSDRVQRKGNDEGSGNGGSSEGSTPLEVIREPTTPGVILEKTTAHAKLPKLGDPREPKGDPEGGGKTGSVEAGTQVWVKSLCTRTGGTSWYEVEFEPGNGPGSEFQYVPDESVLLWSGAVDLDPEEVRSKATEEGSSGGETGGSSGGETGGSSGGETGEGSSGKTGEGSSGETSESGSESGDPQPEAAARKMVVLAQKEWLKGISDTDHDVGIGTVHVRKALTEEIGTENVTVLTRSWNWKRGLDDSDKVVVTGVAEGKDEGAVKQDVANIVNIFVTIGHSEIGSSLLNPSDSEKEWGKYVGGEDEAWCGKFVGSLAKEVGVEREVFQQVLASTRKAYEAGPKGKSSEGHDEGWDELPSLTRVDDGLRTGDIVSVKTSGKNPVRGDHIVLAADSPTEGHLPTVEGNGYGWQPGGGWSQGISKRFRSIDEIKQKYRFTEKHFDGSSSSGE